MVVSVECCSPDRSSTHLPQVADTMAEAYTTYPSYDWYFGRRCADDQERAARTAVLREMFGFMLRMHDQRSPTRRRQSEPNYHWARYVT